MLSFERVHCQTNLEFSCISPLFTCLLGISSVHKLNDIRKRLLQEYHSFNADIDARYTLQYKYYLSDLECQFLKQSRVNPEKEQSFKCQAPTPSS